MSAVRRSRPTTPHPARARKGFTLVELLVVIGIIALLISILLPGLAAARRQAGAVKCAAALRELGNAFQMYSIENKGYYPVVQHDNYVVGSIKPPGGTGNSAAFWWDFIGKYITKSKLGTTSGTTAESNEQRKSVVWGCPAWDGYISGSIITVNRNMPGYSMNLDPMLTPDYPSAEHHSTSGSATVTGLKEKAQITSSVPGKFYKVSQWTHPAERLLLADGKFFNVEQLPLPIGTTQLPGQEGNMSVTYTGSGIAGQNGLDCYRHGKPPGLDKGTQFKTSGGKVAFNILYCDGHVATATDRTEGYKAIRMRFPG
jgi:prepilin-type N-terminal cleavage/methylation domain-containing protein/prepilin-type processing-associated H-X9-DG protein